jgi:flavin reductase (DIM6/NTAB) family NADH-FMN oxidoreductase RutF
MAEIYTTHDRAVPPYEEGFPTPGFLPVTPALISVADEATGIPNIMPAVGWGWLNRLPFSLAVAVSVQDHTREYFKRGTHELLHHAMDFALNIPTDRLREQVLLCGKLSRAKDPKVDKFKEAGLTATPGRRIASPHIAECPINYECKVSQIVAMGSHDLFLGEVVGCFTDGVISEGRSLARDPTRLEMTREDGTVLVLEFQGMIHEVSDSARD